MADLTKANLTADLPGSVVDDLEQPPQDLQEVVAKMRTQEAVVRNIVKMLEGLVRGGFSDAALEIGAKIEDTTEVPQVVTDTAVINHYANADGDRTRDALRVFKHMSVSGVSPNAYTYSIIIKALAAAHSKNPNFNYIGYAKEYFVEMLAKGMQPNEETFLAVLEGVGSLEKARSEFFNFVKAKGFKVPRALELKMTMKMDKLEEHMMKVFEDAVKVCEDEDSQKKFREIGKYYDTMSNYAFLIWEVFLRRGLVEEATELMEQFLETRILPDEGIFITAIFVCGLEGRNRGSGSLKAYQHMLSYGITPSAFTYNLLILMLAHDTNFLGDAKKYLLEMLDKGMKPKAATYTAVLERIARQKDAAADEKCLKFLEVMKAKGFVRDVGPTSFRYPPFQSTQVGGVTV